MDPFLLARLRRQLGAAYLDAVALHTARTDDALVRRELYTMKTELDILIRRADALLAGEKARG